jgi:hypothetical protein
MADFVDSLMADRFLGHRYEFISRGEMPVLFTISQLTSRHGVKVENTPYAGQDEINSCVFDATDFFKVADIEKYKMNFVASRRREAAIEALKAGEAYAALSARLEAVKNRIRELNEYSKKRAFFQNATPTEEESFVARETRNLRTEKKRLLDEIGRLVLLNVGARKEERVLTYKETVLCNSLENMRAILPELRGIDADRLEKTPIFTKSFDELPAKLNGGKPSAIVGGPCLLGTGEMLIRVIHRDGSAFCFDFNTGNYSGNLRDENAVGPHIRENADNIVKILFENKKTALSLQDCEFLRTPMEFARLLDVPVVIPLPDAAYMKYIDAIASSAAPGVRDSAKGDFAAEIRRVSQLFLDVIEELRRRLRPPKLEVLHAGDQRGLDAFYKGRRRYYERFSSFNQGLAPITRETDMVESVTDYIFYPALPFYLWGIENIVQVDSLNETDSLRKCANAHGSDITVFGVLYPEMLDKSASRAMSMAPVELKEYAR